MKRIWNGNIGIILCIVMAVLLFPAIEGLHNASASNGYSHVALLSDLHLPGHNKENKNRIVANLNSWTDLEAVAVLGDITQTRGTPGEYEYVGQYFSQLRAPIWPITGNHDFMYADQLGTNGKKVKAAPLQREEKLERFRQVFSLDSHYYTKQLQGYLLVFLSADDLESARLVSLSRTQLEWLRKTLADNKQMPTIVLCHAPLRGTYSGKGSNVGKKDFYAQPADMIDEILKENHQVFLWLSGHIHIAPSHQSFNSPENLYLNQVLTLHNPDLNGSSYLLSEDVKTTRHKGLLTNSLFLYHDRVAIRMYDHNAQTWLTGERVVIPPKLR